VLSYVSNRTDKENYLSLYRFKSAICPVYLRLYRIPKAINRAHNFWQLGLIFAVIKIRHQVKNHTNRMCIFHFCKIPQNSVEVSEFRGNEKIPRLVLKFRGPRKTVSPTMLLLLIS